MRKSPLQEDFLVQRRDPDVEPDAESLTLSIIKNLVPNTSGVSNAAVTSAQIAQEALKGCKARLPAHSRRCSGGASGGQRVAGTTAISEAEV